MTKRESAAAELAYLLARTRLIVDAVEKDEPSATITAVRAIVEATAAKGDLRGMRSIRNDLLDMARALAPTFRRGSRPLSTRKRPTIHFTVPLAKVRWS